MKRKAKRKREQAAKLIVSTSLKAPTPKINNRNIFFLHVHKCGDTTMCEMAQKYGMSPNPVLNCNVQLDWGCCGNSDTVAAQMAFAKRTTYSFVTCETNMYRSVYPEGYYCVTLLREPKSRYMSHYRYPQRRNSQNHYQHPRISMSGYSMSLTMKSVVFFVDPAAN